MRKRFIAAMPFAAFCSALLSGCDGAVHVSGRVYTYRQPMAGAHGEAVESDPANEPGLRPLGTAKLLLYRSPLAERGQTEAWKSYETTDADGRFSAGGACAPGRTSFSIDIGADGYETLRHRFRTVDTRKDLFFILVPAKGSGPATGASRAAR